MLMRIRQKPNSLLLHYLKAKKKKRAGGQQIDNGCGNQISRERVCLLSRFSAVRTVGSRRSKKESRSTWRGLRLSTNLVEF